MSAWYAVLGAVVAGGMCGVLAGAALAADSGFAATAPGAAAEPVKARLLADAEAVQVGKPFTLGVLLTIEQAWHVYWKNPGDAGMATSVKFEAPPGYSVGPLSWPRPMTFRQSGDVIGYGYEKEVLLTATVTPPKDNQAAGAVTVSAKVAWLACRDQCVQGQASLGLVLRAVPDAKEARPANAELFRAWADRFDPVAPEFTLKDQDGKEVSLAGLRGKVVVLEWFNPDCPFVRRHHVTKSTMVDLARKYGDKGVVWLAVNSTHHMDAQANRKWHGEWKLPYPLLVDQDGTVGRAFQAKSTPHMFVISPEGRIVYQGAIDDDPPGQKPSPLNYVDRVLTEFLAGKPVGEPRTTSYGCTMKYAPGGKT